MYNSVARQTVEEYVSLAEEVTSFAFKRELSRTLGKLQAICFKRDSNLSELSNQVYGELDSLTQKFVTSDEIHSLGENIDDIWEEIESRRTADGIYRLTSQYPSFHQYFTYEPGELHLRQAT